MLAPLLEVTACSFYSLQKGEGAVSQLLDSAWRDRVIDFTDDLHDFCDTAALIEIWIWSFRWIRPCCMSPARSANQFGC